MKKFISLIGLSMMLLLVMVPMSFADEKAPNLDKEARTLKAHERNTKLYTNYDSEDLDEYLDLFDEHETVHESINEIRDELKDLREGNNGFTREEAQAYRKELGEKVKSEEITREEAKVMFEEFTGITKDELDANREGNSTFKEELEALKIKLESNMEERKFVKENIFDQMFENNDEEVGNLLNELLSLQNEHLEYDYEKLDILTRMLDSI
ncbi:hypothetical protein QUF55_01720 [Clostridiaceae bacterium HSG29]|nr:hypothetical protein [Clostridiaceae bacterium HSG29]